MTKEELLEVWKQRYEKRKSEIRRRVYDEFQRSLMIAMNYELERCIFMLEHGRPRTVEDLKKEIRNM